MKYDPAFIVQILMPFLGVKPYAVPVNININISLLCQYLGILSDKIQESISFVEIHSTFKIFTAPQKKKNLLNKY